MEPAILLYRGRSVISGIIRWQTRSEYSHAALLCPDGEVLEAVEFSGVVKGKPSCMAGVDAFRIKGDAGERILLDAIDFATSQIGKGYDYRSIFRFISRRDCSGSGKQNKRWFCSELVFQACKECGLELLQGLDACKVHPGMIASSPFLEPVDLPRANCKHW